MSVGFLLGSPDDAVIWRGPKKNGRNTLFRWFKFTLNSFVLFALVIFQHINKITIPAKVS